MQAEPKPTGSPGCKLFPLDRPVRIDHEIDLEKPDPEAAAGAPAPVAPAPGTTVYNAKVRTGTSSQLILKCGVPL